MNNEISLSHISFFVAKKIKFAKNLNIKRCNFFLFDKFIGFFCEFVKVFHLDDYILTIKRLEI